MKKLIIFFMFIINFNIFCFDMYGVDAFRTNYFKNFNYEEHENAKAMYDSIFGWGGIINNNVSDNKWINNEKNQLIIDFLYYLFDIKYNKINNDYDALRFKDLSYETIKNIFWIDSGAYNAFVSYRFISGKPYTYYHIRNLINIALNDKDITEKDINELSRSYYDSHLFYAYKYKGVDNIEYLIRTNPTFKKFSSYNNIDIEGVLGITNYIYYNGKLVPEYKTGLSGNWTVKVLDKSYSFKELEIKYDGNLENFKSEINTIIGDYGCLITPDKECIFKDEINKLDEIINNSIITKQIIDEYGEYRGKDESKYLNETFIIYQIYEIK